MKKRDEQLSILGDVDQYVAERERREAQAVIRRLDENYMRITAGELERDGPDGLVVIICQEVFRNGRYTKHFYRAILGHHSTVSGRMAHLVADPDEEWPDVVPWGGVAGHPDWPKWNYPSYSGCYWITGKIVEPIPLP